MIEIPIWAFLTGLATILTVFGGAMWRLRGFAATQDATKMEASADVATLKSEHKAHEDICALRYQAIEQRAASLERRIDERHVALEKATDDRHRETRDRFDSIESKLDRLLTTGRAHA